jgi:tetratricopeptide (TPR) repeat protein
MTALRSGERGQAERHLRQLFLRYGLDPDPDTMVLVAQGRLALASALAYRGQRASALTLYGILRKQSTTFHDPRAEIIFATALYNEAMLCALEEPATAAARFAALLKRFAGSENERVRLLVAKAGLARGRLLPAEALPMAQAVEKRFDRSLLPDSKAARAIRVAETNYPWPDHRPARAIFTDSSALDTQEDLALAHQVDLALEVQYRALGETGRYAEQIEVIDSLLARAPVTHRPDIRRLPTTWQTLFRDALSARAVALDHLDQAAAAIAAFTTLVEWTWSAHDALSENALAGALVNRTIIEIKSGQPATALQTGGAFLGRFRWTRDPGVARERFKLLLLIGQLQAQTGHPAEALSIFRAMERSLAEKLDPALAELAARSLHKMVTLLSQAGALPEAALICRALITRFAKEEWPAIEEAVAAALIELGEIEEKRGDLTAEAAVYEELFARFGPRYGDNDNPALAPFLAFGRLRQAGMRKRAGDAEGAIALRRAFIARYESSDNETIAGYVLDEGIRLGDALGQQGDRAGEIAVYEPLLARYAQTEFPRVQAQLAATWFAKAYAQEKAGDHEAEIATYAALATALGDSTLPAVQVYIAWAICNRAMTLVRQDRAPEAIVDFVEPMARFEAQIQENPEANPGLGEPVAKFFYQRAFLFSESGQHRAALAEHMALAERLAHHPARSVRERVLRSRYRVAGLLAQLSTTPGEAAAVFLGAEEARQADPESADDPFVANLRSAYLSGQMVTDEAERSLLDNRSHLPAETNSAARIAGLIMQALAASLEEHYAEAAALCDEAERLARDAEIPVPVEVLLIRLKIAIDNDRSDEATTLISVLRADPRVSFGRWRKPG